MKPANNKNPPVSIDGNLKFCPQKRQQLRIGIIIIFFRTPVQDYFQWKIWKNF